MRVLFFDFKNKGRLSKESILYFKKLSRKSAASKGEKGASKGVPKASAEMR